jgi:capsular polysaccharide export protein
MRACYFYNFSRVKWHLIKDFFDSPSLCSKCIRVSSLNDALTKALDEKATVYFWGKNIDEELLEYCRKQSIEVRFVEDGFIRSLGLGSALSKPFSLVMDSRGIYFDPTAPSDLEYILENTEFSEEQLKNAAEVLEAVTRLKLSKYNHQMDVEDLGIKPSANQKVILVPGQVDDDMSVKFGAFGLNNMSLLERVRLSCPDAYIIYKPHPDVLSKNRLGDLSDDIPLKYADIIIKHVGIDSVLAHVDEIHTMTSLVGFDALVRKKKVVTYGLPFYAGWGLTEDERKSSRRTRRLTLLELVAGALLVYPKYYHPKTGFEVNVFEVLEYIALEKQKLKENWFKRTQLKFQGVFLPRIRNLLKNFRHSS